jgi:replicative DNA helicase
MAITYNENIEASVLACLLRNATNYAIIEDLLDKQSFGLPAFSQVFSVIKFCVESDIYPDHIIVEGELDRRGILDSIIIPSNGLRGKEAIRYLKNLDADENHLESYAIQVSEMKAARQIIALSDRMKMLVEEGKRPYDILSEIDTDTGKIGAFIGVQSKNNRTSKEVALSNVQQLEDTLGGKSRYISTGLKSWDNFTGGLYPSRVYMVAARSNEGKTSLSLNIALHVAGVEGKAVKIFTFESSAEEIQNKLIQIKTGISAIRIEKGELSDEEIELYKKALEEISKLPISYDDSSELTLPLLRTKIRKAVADGAEVIIIDQLEQVLIGGSGDSQPEYIKINYMAYRIKAFAREMDTRIILVHQLNRKGEGSENRNKIVDPVLSDLAQAGEKAPDVVMMIRTSHEPALFCVKNRQGPKGKQSINWDGSRMKFSDFDYNSLKPEFVQSEL